jgi:hypothetical protein
MNTHLTLVALSLAVDFSLFAADDTTFGNGDELCSLPLVGAILVQPDAKIVVDVNGGWLHFLNQRTGVFGRIPGGVFRFESDGSVDHSFRSDLGREPASTIFNRCLALQADGKLLASDQDGRAVRLNANGRLDETFALRRAETNAAFVWAHAEVLNRFALGPAGQIVVRAPSTGWDHPPVNGEGFGLPMPAVQWFDPSGRFVRASAWAENSPDLAAWLTTSGIRAGRAHRYVRDGSGEKAA